MIYGMGEQAIIDLGNTLRDGGDPRSINGLCYISKEPVEEYIQIPTHQECLDEKEKYIDLLKLFMIIMILYIQKVYAKELILDI